MTRSEFLAHLDALQDECAPINLTIGASGEGRNPNPETVTLHDAPPVVFLAIARMANDGQIHTFDVHICPQGLRVTFPRGEVK